MPLDTTSIIGEDGDKTRCPRCSGKVIICLLLSSRFCLFLSPNICFAFYRFLLPKKWWQPLDIITGIVSDVAFVVNHWILHLFVMVLMTRFIVGCVMDVLGNKPLVLIILLYVYFFKPWQHFEWLILELLEEIQIFICSL